jgi:tetratricopeptide (TPR) repeat protein
MKAEHRKELHTNVLADSLGRFVDKAKSGSGLIWGGLIVLVALGVAWWWWTASSANRASDAWAAYWNNRDSVTDIESISGRLKGTAAEKAAKLALADQLYKSGYHALFDKTPKEAQASFSKAFEVYDELAQASVAPEIGVRAVLGAAKCQESLGELERAIYFYDEAVSRFDKPLRNPSGEQHPLVAEAERRAKELREGTAVAFYRGKNGEKPWPYRLPLIETEATGPPPVGPSTGASGK